MGLRSIDDFASEFGNAGTTLRFARCLAVVLLLMQAPAAVAQQQHSLPLFNPADSVQQGFLRIINRSDRAGAVRIHAVDDSGERFGPVNLSLGAMASAHLNSMDLEDGNPDKGLSGGIGDGDGDWRLDLTTDLDIEPLAYIRTSDGFVTSVHDVVQPQFDYERYLRRVSPNLYHVPFFNPGKNANQVSRLRLINASSTETLVTITGRDDAGASPPGGDVSITLPAYAARTITAQQLEDGGAGLEGSFGQGTGKWQLFIYAKETLYEYTRPIQVVSLLFSRGTGNLANLSSIGPGNDPNRGGDGVDWITGGGGDDVLNPGDNDDLFDTVYGSEGNDRIVFSDSGPTAYQWLGYSGLSSGIKATINGITNRATVDKGALGTDTIVDIANPLNAGKEAPYGGLGVGGTPFDDTFDLTLDEGQWMEVEGHAGNDRFNVRSGNVRLSYRFASKQGIDVDLAAGRVNDDGFGGVDTIVGHVHSLVGGASDDTIRGTDGVDQLEGGPGDDEINPRDNHDWDAVYASTGNDRIVYTENENGWQSLHYDRSLVGTLPELDESGVTVTLDGAANRATVDKGSNGTDTIVDVSKPLDAGWTTGGLGLYGTKGDDVFNLTLDREQWMLVRGEAGNDTFNLRSHRWESEALQSATIRVDYVSSPGGIEIDLRAGRATNDGFGNVDTFTFNDGDFQIRGSNLSDTILGSDGDDLFIGRGGDDVIDGRGGWDQVRFDRNGVGAVVVDLGKGTATGTWFGEAFSYTLTSIEYVRGSNSSAGDNLVGGNGDDRFRGNGGDDFLEGGGGNDRLEGGRGDDIFAFEGAHGYDRIDDFEDGADILLLLGLSTLSKQDILDHAYAWDEGTGVHIDLTGFGGGTIDLHGFHRDQFDASDFLL
ncbi:MAG: calcium-binding protein [Gammaproteobacteria bacterium]|nr:calcium-binding protein [Gammaproteobacteria bacterium]